MEGMDMKLSDDTGQARDVALLGLASDQPVRVDTAMKAAAVEYHGAGGRYPAGDILRLWDGPRLA